MCRKSPANKYRTCYLHKPRLSTIREEADDCKSLRLSIPKHVRTSAQSPVDSPKGFRRLLSSAFLGSRSPRCTPKSATSPLPSPKSVRSPRPSPKFNGQFSWPPNQRQSPVMSDIGSMSPLCRRATKNQNKQVVSNSSLVVSSITNKNLLDLNSKVLSDSPRTSKRYIDNNNNLGNQSPQCRRIARSNSLTKAQVSTVPNSPKPSRSKSIGSAADFVNKSPSSKRFEQNQNKNKNKQQAKEPKEKSLFKRMVKFLTVPQEDYLNA